MPVIPRGFVSQSEIANEVERVKHLLAPDVVKLSYSVTEDMSGNPAIYFRVVLSDAAAQEENLPGSARTISAIVNRELEPYSRWSLYPYFRFRNESEYRSMKDPAWD